MAESRQRRNAEGSSHPTSDMADSGEFWRHLNASRAALRAIDDLDDPFGDEFPRLWNQVQALDLHVDAAKAVAEDAAGEADD